jgi:hypothetical protein
MSGIVASQPVVGRILYFPNQKPRLEIEGLAGEQWLFAIQKPCVSSSSAHKKTDDDIPLLEMNDDATPEQAFRALSPLKRWLWEPLVIQDPDTGIKRSVLINIRSLQQRLKLSRAEVLNLLRTGKIQELPRLKGLIEACDFNTSAALKIDVFVRGQNWAKINANPETMKCFSRNGNAKDQIPLSLDLSAGNTILIRSRKVRLLGKGTYKVVKHAYEITLNPKSQSYSSPIPKARSTMHVSEGDSWASTAEWEAFHRLKGCYGIVQTSRMIWTHSHNDRRKIVLVQPLYMESLEETLYRYPPLPLMAKLKILEDVLQGLANLHKNRLLHRDLLLGNFLIRLPEAEAVISDFGLSCDMDDSAATGTFFTTQRLAPPEAQPYMKRRWSLFKKWVGTPEQSRAITTPALDVFYLGRSLAELFRDIGNGEPTPEPIGHLLRDMQLPNPLDRPSAQQALDRLKDV